MGLSCLGLASTQNKASNMYFKAKWNSEWEAWNHFLCLVAKKTSAWIFVFDRGFKNQYLLKYVYSVLKRTFLIRICPSQHVYILSPKKAKKRKHISKYSIPDRISKRIDSFLDEGSAISLKNGKLCFMSGVIVRSWVGEFREEVSIIVLHRNGFKKPMVLCISIAKISLEEAIQYLQIYFRRWGIEELFKELKSWFCFEKFKTIALESIEKYLAMVIFVHSLLSQGKEETEYIPELREVIGIMLKKFRNIADFTVIGLKIFLEMMFLKPSSMKLFKRLLPAYSLTFIL